MTCATRRGTRLPSGFRQRDYGDSDSVVPSSAEIYKTGLLGTLPSSTTRPPFLGTFPQH